ncbi:hypothetical protein GWI33_018632 [Rhynchophorus ferrugineus]|uniref:Uncharacterized protein n=1 Tax=Rhynchophorus ferrugineus TaxID=354439 RepID=A0A834M609_RHYFE|nr:hypothetical protein GWI33_018632 [Rhynchophorus ferrugineus]
MIIVKTMSPSLSTICDDEMRQTQPVCVCCSLFLDGSCVTVPARGQHSHAEEHDSELIKRFMCRGTVPSFVY